MVGLHFDGACGDLVVVLDFYLHPEFFLASVSSSSSISKICASLSNTSTTRILESTQLGISEIADRSSMDYPPILSCSTRQLADD